MTTPHPTPKDTRALRAMRRYFRYTQHRVDGRRVLCGGVVRDGRVEWRVPESERDE